MFADASSSSSSSDSGSSSSEIPHSDCLLVPAVQHAGSLVALYDSLSGNDVFPPARGAARPRTRFVPVPQLLAAMMVLLDPLPAFDVRHGDAADAYRTIDRPSWGLVSPSWRRQLLVTTAILPTRLFFTEESFSAIAGLATFRNVRTLSFFVVDFRREWKRRALQNALAALPALRKLLFRGCVNLDVAALAAMLRSSLPELHTFSAQSHNPAREGLAPTAIAELCEALACKPAVRVVEFGGNRPFPMHSDAACAVAVDALCELVAGAPELRSVGLVALFLGDAAITRLSGAIAATTQLRQISLCFNDIQTPGLAALRLSLRPHRGLRKLVINAAEGADVSQLVAVIADHPLLTDVVVAMWYMTPSEVISVCAAVKSLARLKLFAIGCPANVRAVAGGPQGARAAAVTPFDAAVLAAVCGAVAAQPLKCLMVFQEMHPAALRDVLQPALALHGAAGRLRHVALQAPAASIVDVGAAVGGGVKVTAIPGGAA
jgi:hypothetical protein